MKIIIDAAGQIIVSTIRKKRTRDINVNIKNVDNSPVEINVNISDSTGKDKK